MKKVRHIKVHINKKKTLCAPHFKLNDLKCIQIFYPTTRIFFIILNPCNSCLQHPVAHHSPISNTDGMQTSTKSIP